MKIDQDNFEEWREHPLTRALMHCCEVWAQEAKTQWVEGSWDGGIIDPVRHARLRERAATLEELASVSRQKMEEALA